MAVLVYDNEFSEYVKGHLLTIYPALQFMDYQVNGHPVHLTTVHQSNHYNKSTGERILTINASWHPGNGDTIIFGQFPDFAWDFGTLASQGGGIQRWERRQRSNIVDSIIVYDVLGCLETNGYVVFGPNGNCIDLPPDALLLHELAHSVLPVSATQNDREYYAILEENNYRRECGLPAPRVTHDGACYETAVQAGLCGPYSGAGTSDVDNQHVPPGPGGNTFAGYDCFIATAARGGPHAPDVEQLRFLRDEILLRSSWGRTFFSVFYKHYYSFAPDIATQMHGDAEMRHAIGFALVEPLLTFLKIVHRLPDLHEEAELLPGEGHALQWIISQIDEWLSIVPLPHDLAARPWSEALEDVRLAFTYLVRDCADRAEYIASLRESGDLPLRGPVDALRRLNIALTECGLSFAQRSQLLGTKHAAVRAKFGCTCHTCDHAH